MHSSTSNSKSSGARARRQRACLLIFLGTFALACAFSRFLQSCVPAKHAWRIEPGELAPPTEEPTFLAYRGGTVDHYVYYADIGGAVSSARSADILILGNSNAELRRFRTDTGLRIYNLCFNLNERAEFARVVMQRHALRPEVALVNADYFFSEGMSAAAVKITREGQWRAVMNWAEKIAGHAVSRRLHRWLPYFDWAARVTGDGLVYRSATDGAWLVVKGPHDDRPLQRPALDDAQPSPEEIRYAERFQNDLAAHGTALVLTWVPYPGGSQHRAEILAEALGVPFLRGAESGLRLRDYSHLTPHSAATFTRALLEQLITLDQIKPLLAGDTP